MADRTIKPDDTNDLVLSNNHGDAKIEVNEDDTIVVTSGGDVTIDATGDIILDADGADIKLKDGGVQFGTLKQASTHLVIQPESSKEIILNDEGGSAALTIETNGDVTVDAGNLVIPSADKGISFTGGTDPDTTGTATGNILNDFEVGTWTPAQGGSWTTWTGTTIGTYMRIGDSVTVWGQLQAGTFDPGSTSVYIDGLPFSNSGIQGVGSVSKGASAAAVLGNFLASGTTLYPDVDWGSVTDVKFTVSYYFG